MNDASQSIPAIPMMTCVDMHTGGEPVRIVTGGYPEIIGDTILAKRRYVRDHLDHLRRFLMFEPRGHFDMYGVIPVEPDDDEADMAVLFMHNEGYSTMCGHAVIALGRYAIDQGIVTPPADADMVDVNIQCPCGLVRAHVALEDDKPGAVRFESVPSFAFALDREIEVNGYGSVTLDVGYGGAFYAIVPASRVGLDVRTSKVRDLVDAASAITAAARQQISLSHPDDNDLAFFYGTILSDGADAFSVEPTANICVFADAQVDRSPTGSGVSARIALQHARGQIAMEQTRVFEGVSGAHFSGAVSAESTCGDFPAVRAMVEGRAHYVGQSTFRHEPDDVIGQGFLLR